MRTRFNAVLVSIGLLLVLPAIALAERVRRGAGRQVAVRGLRWLVRACGVGVEVRGCAGAGPGDAAVFVPNHSSLIDVPAMLLAVPDVRFAAAAELFRIPLLGSAMRALDTVPVDRGRPREARRELRELAHSPHPLRVAVFAQGGIEPVTEPLRFRTGAFALAIESGAKVIPVTITGAPAVLPPGHRFSVRPRNVVVHLLAPIATEGLGPRDRRSLRDRSEAAVAQALAAAA